MHGQSRRTRHQEGGDTSHDGDNQVGYKDTRSTESPVDRLYTYVYLRYPENRRQDQPHGGIQGITTHEKKVCSSRGVQPKDQDMNLEFMRKTVSPKFPVNRCLFEIGTMCRSPMHVTLDSACTRQWNRPTSQKIPQFIWE